MKFAKENLNLENALDKEWIITNGIGGFASSTIIGANTRKYHGLLVAPLTPPARRHVILSKVDESIQIGKIADTTGTSSGEIAGGENATASFAIVNSTSVLLILFNITFLSFVFLIFLFLQFSYLFLKYKYFFNFC